MLCSSARHVTLTVPIRKEMVTSMYNNVTNRLAVVDLSELGNFIDGV